MKINENNIISVNSRCSRSRRALALSLSQSEREKRDQETAREGTVVGERAQNELNSNFSDKLL